MIRVLRAGLFALPLLLATSQSASAQFAPAAPIAPAGFFPGAFGGCAQMGCGGFCFRFLSKLHYHGPLFNYGPYTGYYPFEPYGPWTADLRYTGPRGPINDCGGSCGQCGGCQKRLFGNGLGHGLGWGRDRGCGGCGACGECKAWGNYAKATLANVFHRCHPCANKCPSGGSVVTEPACPNGNCGHVSATPTPSDRSFAVSEASPVEQAAGVEAGVIPRRER